MLISRRRRLVHLKNSVAIGGGCYQYFRRRRRLSRTAYTSSRVLHFVVRNYYMHLGFYGSYVVGTSIFTINTWYHVAFVYDYAAQQQILYFNGVQDSIRLSTGPYLGANGSINIGMTNMYGGPPDCFDGYVHGNRPRSSFFNDLIAVEVRR